MWTDVHQQAFEKLKRPLVDTPVLTTRKEGCKLKIYTDASGTGIGAVLQQVEPEGKRPLAFASRTLNLVEQNYCFRAELLFQSRRV